MKLESRAQKIINRLRKEGKVKDIPSPFTYEDQLRFEKIMRESRRKQAGSAMAASKIIINT